jgi:hypothetical protein
MTEVFFTSHLRRVVPERSIELECQTVLSALNDSFIRYPKLRHYILDDQGCLRPTIRIYVDGQPANRKELSKEIRSSAKIYVF